MGPFIFENLKGGEAQVVFHVFNLTFEINVRWEKEEEGRPDPLALERDAHRHQYYQDVYLRRY
ncbi:hypothetical protein [Caldalkalibacillus salinus]|uniref:hypothetical protein n=1 Tax=Caldalkalibacillus salinus TaxID=2803787 RepID=UPI00192492FB|nr:hypothetical protein [Caldalkalibacillus salinus]